MLYKNRTWIYPSVLALLCALWTGIPVHAAGMSHFTPSETYQETFPDVSEKQWFHSSVKLCYEYDLMKGTGDGGFHPQDDLTVAQALVMADRVHQIYETGCSTLRNGSPWYRPYVNYALEHNILDGEWDSYDRPISRSEMAFLFSRSLPRTELVPINQVHQIPDVSVDSNYGTSIYTLYRAGVLTGGSGGYFRPDDPIVRAEAAAILARIVIPEQRKAFTLDGTPPLPNVSETMAFQLEGLYSIPVEDGNPQEREVAEVRVIGDRISAELGYVTGTGECYSFWAYDLAPEDPSLLQETGDTVLSCTGVEYSLMQGDASLPQRVMEIGMQDGQLMLNGTLYSPDPGPSPFHSSPAELRDAVGFVQQDLTGAPMIGQWFGSLNGETRYVSFTRDGSVIQCIKAPGQPMAVYVGIFAWDTSGYVTCVLERIGCGRMPQQELAQLTFPPDGSLEINGFPLYPAPDHWSMDGMFGNLLTEQVNIGSESEEPVFVCHLPAVNGSDYHTEGLNDLILADFGDLIRTQQKQIAEDGFCSFPSVSWSAVICDDILSLRIWADSTTDYREYKTYFYHVTYHDILQSREVLALRGIAGAEFVDRTKLAVRQYFSDRWGQLSPTERDAMGYDYFLDQTLNEIHTEMMYFLAPDGTPISVVPVGTMAGAGICYTPLALP